MNIRLPRGWFARILLGGWALYFVGTLVFFLLAFLIPGRLTRYLITPLWILSIFVVLGTFIYSAVYSVRRLLYYLGRKDGSQAPAPLRPVERILVAGWLLFIVIALGSLLFSREKWVSAYGPEVLFSLLGVVILSSLTYGSYLLLRQVMKHLRRS